MEVNHVMQRGGVEGGRRVIQHWAAARLTSSRNTAPPAADQHLTNTNQTIPQHESTHLMRRQLQPAYRDRNMRKQRAEPITLQDQKVDAAGEELQVQQAAEHHPADGGGAGSGRDVVM